MRPRHGAGAQYLGIDRVFSGERIWLAGFREFRTGLAGCSTGSGIRRVPRFSSVLIAEQRRCWCQ
jgi:hypothetical protein